MSLCESTVEDAALAWFGELGYSLPWGRNPHPGVFHGERASYSDVMLVPVTAG